MGDINKAPNDFFENWNNLKSMPYKNVIEQFVKRSDENKMMNATQFGIENFPKKVRKDLTVSETNIFYHGLSGLFKDEKWWKDASVADACTFYLSCARNFMPYFKDYAQEEDHLSQKQKNEIFSLYQICTLFISWNAMREKNLRKIMGIKKGLFLR